MKPRQQIKRIRNAQSFEEKLLAASGLDTSDFGNATIDHVEQLARLAYFLSKNPDSRPKKYVDAIHRDLAAFGYKIAFRIEQGDTAYLRRLAAAVDLYREGKLGVEKDPSRVAVLMAYLNHECGLCGSFPPTVADLAATARALGGLRIEDRMVRKLVAEMGLQVAPDKAGRPPKKADRKRAQ